MPDQDWRVEPILLLLFLGIILSAIAVIAIKAFIPGDGQLFQVIASILSAFVGAFFLRVNPKSMASQDVIVKAAEVQAEKKA
jgi:uncharacterized membrane-anchored protein